MWAYIVRRILLTIPIVLGVFVIVYPGLGVLGLVWTIGAYAVVFGVMMIALGFRLRSWGVAHEVLAAG